MWKLENSETETGTWGFGTVFVAPEVVDEETEYRVGSVDAFFLFIRL